MLEVPAESTSEPWSGGLRGTWHRHVFGETNLTFMNCISAVAFVQEKRCVTPSPPLRNGFIKTLYTSPRVLEDGHVLVMCLISGAAHVEMAGSSLSRRNSTNHRSSLRACQRQRAARDGMVLMTGGGRRANESSRQERLALWASGDL